MALGKLYDKQYVIARYSISMATLNRWVSTGKIPYIKIGKSVFFKEAELNEWETQRGITSDNG